MTPKPDTPDSTTAMPDRSTVALGSAVAVTPDSAATPDSTVTVGGAAIPDSAVIPEGTAVRVALWRAMHLEVDAPPHVLCDPLGLELAAPKPDWRQRPDMDPKLTGGHRAAIVARARFVEDLVTAAAEWGVGQYVILGAGLDTYSQRRPESAAKLRVFEVDQPGPQEWKRRRLIESGHGIPDELRFVPVDFEAGDSWWQKLSIAGFDAHRPAVVASTGVSMYLSKDANMATLRQLAALAPGSTLAMTFQLPQELVDPQDRPAREAALKGASASGTPFISFFTPDEMLAMAREAGFAEAEHVSGVELNERFFAARTDGLRMSTGEDFLVATT